MSDQPPDDRSRAELLAELARLQRINEVLIRRVQRSVDSAGNDFGLFEQNLRLESLVRERTAQLEARNRELQRARRVAESAAAAKSRFLARMSHELRTPLNVVIGGTELLEADDNPLSPSQEHMLGVMGQASSHLLGLIDDILDFSRAEDGKLGLRTGPLQLRGMIAATLDALRHMPTARGLTLSAEIDPAVPETIAADERRLRQVLVNLVGNGCKFTDTGGVSIRVGLRDGTLHFRVRDTGVGMSHRAQERLFEQFTQGDGGDARRHGGAGLGLAICRQLVTLWGGAICLDSRQGEGTSVHFTLPLTEVETPALPAAPPAPPPATTHDQPVVLLVDDNAINRLVARRMLEHLGAQVHEADSGKAALDHLDACAAPPRCQDLRV